MQDPHKILNAHIHTHTPLDINATKHQHQSCRRPTDQQQPKKLNRNSYAQEGKYLWGI